MPTSAPSKGDRARAAGHKKDSNLAAQFRGLAARHGKKKAAVAVGHTILVIAYHLLTRPDLYHDLGSAYFDERQRTRSSATLGGGGPSAERRHITNEHFGPMCVRALSGR